MCYPALLLHFWPFCASDGIIRWTAIKSFGSNLFAKASPNAVAIAHPFGCTPSSQVSALLRIGALVLSSLVRFVEGAAHLDSNTQHTGHDSKNRLSEPSIGLGLSREPSEHADDRAGPGPTLWARLWHQTYRLFFVRMSVNK